MEIVNLTNVRGRQRALSTTGQMKLIVGLTATHEHHSVGQLSITRACIVLQTKGQINGSIVQYIISVLILCLLTFCTVQITVEL